MPATRIIVALEVHGLPANVRSLLVIGSDTLLMYRLQANRSRLLSHGCRMSAIHRLTGRAVKTVVDGIPTVGVVKGAIRTSKGAHRLPAKAASRRNGRATANANARAESIVLSRMLRNGITANAPRATTANGEDVGEHAPGH